MADYRLNQQQARSTQAFLRGFYDIMQPGWVRMFNERELQMLISGSAAEGGLDLQVRWWHLLPRPAELKVATWCTVCQGRRGCQATVNTAAVQLMAVVCAELPAPCSGPLLLPSHASCTESCSARRSRRAR